MRIWIGFLIAAVIASFVLTVATKTDIGAYLMVGTVMLAAITAFMWWIVTGTMHARRRF